MTDAEHEELLAWLAEAIKLAEEGWSHASDFRLLLAGVGYFDSRIEEPRAVLPQEPQAAEET